ncbi:DUF397 domain-containing protein [Streptomyces sp. MNU89]|uniref:DUF397 domain-containing protein n=1 Tax=Streptomyces sp. MNU89 TaxID=2560025 RepID=UPI001E4D8B5E|nr:DUF397 domain-containing protein [Streptomyces sp. MNU89]MCC9742898.1 DUF397 domain-containing protein [Streptomyces sp. MNU89]
MSDEKPAAIAAREWFKSSYSAGNGGDCVEVSVAAGTVHVRDSKDHSGPVLSVADAEWAAFTRFAAEL